VTVRPLRLLGDPVLRTPCDPVVRFDDALARLVGDLLDTVAEPGRAGLAPTRSAPAWRSSATTWTANLAT
jgi:peptide deformylase